MGFKKGAPKPLKGGRKKGTPNKRQSVLEICAGIGLDPFKKMAEIAQQDEHPRQVDCLKELCQYILPKQKHVDIGIDPEKSKITIVIEEYGPKK